MNRSITLVDWGLLLAECALVGSTFLFINVAVKEVSPLAIAALRAIMSALICWTVMRAYGARLPRNRRGWTALFWLGLLTSAIPFLRSHEANSISKAARAASCSAPCQS